MLNELFEAVDKLKSAEEQMKQASEEVDRKLQDMKNYFDEYARITQNVFGNMISGPQKQEEKKENKTVAKIEKEQPIKKTTKRGRPAKHVFTRQERLDIIDLIENDGLRPCDVAKKLDIRPAYIYNLLSDYRHGKLDLPSTSLVTKEWVK